MLVTVILPRATAATVFPTVCTDKASGDMMAWGEVPNAVLMHDTNVTFEYHCGNTNPELPFWTITGGAFYSF